MKSKHASPSAAFLSALASILALAPVFFGFCLCPSQSRANAIFTESFDAGLANWNILHAHFSTTGGVLRGNGDGDRGAMYRSASGANELRFSFLRTLNSDTRNSGDTIEVGFVTQPSVSIYRTFGGVGPSVLFESDARNPDGDAGFQIHDGAGNVVLWRFADQVAGGTWYDGLIQLLPNNTVTFGYKPSSATNYIMSSGYALPAGFAPSFVGVSAYRVPPNEGATGVAVLDNITGCIIPEPTSSFLLLAGICAATASRRRTKSSERCR